MAAQVLIVGAGPTGLAAALFLTRKGVAVRIIDKAAEPSRTSRALAVSPRTLELLEPTGLSARIEAEGRPMRTFELRRDGSALVTIDIADAHPRFQMTALSQARTEALLAEALADLGVRPERGVALDSLEQDAGRVAVRLIRNGGDAETVETPILFAADGAHSVVRHQLAIDFPGSSFVEPWRLADVEFHTRPDAPEGFVELYPDGLVFALALTDTYWRFISTIGDPMDTLPPHAQVRNTPWRSDFHISHRIAARLNLGRVCLAGDAAHLHSPVGARGMNLGIEDAYVFADIAAVALEANTDPSDRLADYGRIRRAVDRKVVRRIETVSRMARGGGPWSLVRRVAPTLASHAAPLRNYLREVATGLDHPVRLS